jgi:large subunit ribosomal protein L15
MKRKPTQFETPKPHTITPKPGSTKRRRRVGRGIAAGQGASCGLGMRGQKSRSGTGTRPGFEGGQMPLYRRLPKLKHFPQVEKNKVDHTIINVYRLNSLSPNSEVDLESLMEWGIVTTNDGPLKILGYGEITVPLTVRAAAFSGSAREKISLAGGTCEILPLNKKDNTISEKVPYPSEMGFVQNQPINEETQLMGVVSHTENGYRKFTLHSHWQDSPVDSARIPKQKVGPASANENIADQYLQDVIRNALTEEEKDKYTFERYESKTIKFTNTFVAEYHQYYMEFPLYGSFVTIELDLDKNRELLAVSSNIGMGNIQYPLEHSSEITPDKLREIVIKNAGYNSPESLPNLEIDGKYWFYQTNTETWYLSYVVENVLKYEDRSQEDNRDKRPEIVDYIIDAFSGDLIDEIPCI